jgi:glutamate dehydrogenase (NAD(P)+)
MGISDATGYLYHQNGLPIAVLFGQWQDHGLVTRPFFMAQRPDHANGVKYANEPDDLLREDAFCLIPAAPMANYLDTDTASMPSMTVDRMGCWTLIVEGANT